MNKLIKILYIIMFLIFSSILFIVTTGKVNSLFQINNIIFILISFIILIIWYFIYKLLNKYSNKCKLISVILLVIIELVVLFIISGFEIPLGWDFDIITVKAFRYAYYNELPLLSRMPWYFQIYTNNQFLYVIEVFIFKLLHIFKNNNPLSVLEFINAFVIFLSIIFNYLYIKKVFGNVKACFSLFITLFFIPLFLYIPIIYSDSLSMVFIPVLLYISTFFNDDKKYKRILSFILFALFTFIGCKIKMTVLFISLSIIVYNALKKYYKQAIIAFVSIILIFIPLSKLFNYYVNYDNRFGFKYNESGSFPYTHWLMVGIDEIIDSDSVVYGGYSERDYLYTLSFNSKEERTKANIEVIKRRLKEYGFLGYLKFLTKKISYTWGDGAYFSYVVVQWHGAYNLNGYQTFLTGYEKNHIMLYFMNGVQYALLILMLGKVVSSIKNNKYDGSIYLFSISLLFLFLLFWETRSRYLYHYIPLFIIIISITIDKINIKKEVLYEKKR